jgi:hypothetical protein
MRTALSNKISAAMQPHTHTHKPQRRQGPRRRVGASSTLTQVAAISDGARPKKHVTDQHTSTLCRRDELNQAKNKKAGRAGITSTIRLYLQLTTLTAEAFNDLVHDPEQLRAIEITRQVLAGHTDSSSLKRESDEAQAPSNTADAQQGGKPIHTCESNKKMQANQHARAHSWSTAMRSQARFDRYMQVYKLRSLNIHT